MSAQKFEELAAINVGDKIEKKNGLSYLSWAYAVDTLLRHDSNANWEYKEPVKFGESVMVFCSVTAFGKTRTAQLPVMDHRNKCILNPDAFAVNTAMQRCLAKAIALHGIGLYIYAGEDLPQEETAAEKRDTSSQKNKEKIDTPQPHASSDSATKNTGVLKQELLDYNFGKVEDAADMLKALSTFTGKDGVEKWATWDKIDTISATWESNILKQFYIIHPKIKE